MIACTLYTYSFSTGTIFVTGKYYMLKKALRNNVMIIIIRTYNNGIKRELPEFPDVGILFFKTVPIWYRHRYALRDVVWAGNRTETQYGKKQLQQPSEISSIGLCVEVYYDIEFEYIIFWLDTGFLEWTSLRLIADR